MADMFHNINMHLGDEIGARVRPSFACNVIILGQIHVFFLAFLGKNQKTPKIHEIWTYNVTSDALN